MGRLSRREDFVFPVDVAQIFGTATAGSGDRAYLVDQFGRFDADQSTADFP
jgi:hypothetical protein